MYKYIKLSITIAFFIGFFMYATDSYAITCTSNATGNWNATGTWTGCTGGNGTTANTPGSADTAVITTTHNVTVTVGETVSALEFGAAATAGIVTVNSGITLTVTNAITMRSNNASNTAGTFQNGTGAGTITASSLVIGDAVAPTGARTAILTSTINTLTINGSMTTTCGDGTGARAIDPRLSLNSGSMSISGTISLCILDAGEASFLMDGGTQNATLTLSNAAPWSVSVGAVTTLNGIDATVNYSGASPVIFVTTYENLTLSGSGTPTGAVTTVNGDLITSGTVSYTTGANLAIAEILSVGTGTTLTTGANFTLAITGTSSITGTLANSNTGTKTFTGAVTINSGGSFTNANNSSLTFQGGLTNNSSGTVSFGTTGTTVTFSINNQSITGSQSITFGATVAITGAITVTNSNSSTVTISGDLTGSAGGSTWRQGANTTTLFAGAVLTTGTIDASTNTPNTIEYSANGTQTIKAPSVSYYHLILSGTGTATKTAGGAFTVDGNFTIGGNTTFDGGTTLTHVFKGNWVVDTTAAASPYSFTTSGTVNFDIPGTPASTSISGTSSQTIAFSSINFNNTSGVTVSENLTSAGTITIAANVTVTPGAGITIGGSGTLTGSGTIKVTKISGTNDFLLQYTITGLTLTNLTVDYNGINQGFSNTTYGNVLISTNSIQTGAGTGTIGGTFTVGASGTFTPASGTTTFNNGSSISNSGTLSFNNIIIASSATVTTSSSFTINGTLTNSSTGTFNPSGGTITMATTGWSIINSGTSLQFNNLTISETPGVQPTSSFSVNGTLTVNSVKTLAPTAGTITMTGGSIANNGGAASNLVFNNLTISGSVTANSQSFNIAGATSITGTLTVSSGSGTITANGNVTGTGTMSLTSGTFTQNIGAARDFGPTSTNDWNFNILTFSSSTGSQTVTATSTSTGKVIIASTLTIGTNTTLDAANRTWQLTATGTPFSLSGSFTGSTSTFSYLGSASGVIVTGASYYNLGVGTNANSTATTFTLGGNTSVQNTLTVGDPASSANDTLDASSRTLTLSGTGTPFNITANGLYSESTSTVNYTGTSAGVTVTVDTYNNLGVGTTGDANSVTYTLNSSITVSGILTIGASSGAGTHSFDPTSATITLSATGTPLVVNSQGSLSPSTSTISYTGTSSGVTVAGTTYYNLRTGTTADSNTVAYTLGANAIVNNVLTIGASSGAGVHSFDCSSRTLTLAGTTGAPISIGSQGTLTPSTSTITYTGNNSGGNTTLVNVSFYNLTLNNSSETWNAAASPLAVIGNLIVTTGSLDMGSQNLTVGSSAVVNSGGISNSGTITQSSSATTTILSSSGGTASVGGSGTTTFYNLTIAPTVASAPIITLGTGASQTINITNTFTIGNGSNDVTVTASSNDPTLNIDGNISISPTGSLTSTGSTLFVAGNFSNSGGFAHDSGTVQIDGSGTSILSGVGSPAFTFHNLTANTASKTLNFTAGSTFRVNGILTLTNQSINSTTASQWFINHQGTESVTGSTITNSGCDGSSTLITVDITDTSGGNNGSCWDFASVIYPNSPVIKGNTRIKGNVRLRN